MTEPGVAGEWSVKDIVAHLNSFERWYADRLHEALRGEVYTPTEFDWLPFDERNERVFQQNRHRPLADVLAESRQAKLQQELQSMQGQRDRYALHLLELQDEVERIARLLLDEPELPFLPAPHAA